MAVRAAPKLHAKKTNRCIASHERNAVLMPAGLPLISATIHLTQYSNRIIVACSKCTIQCSVALILTFVSCNDAEMVPDAVLEFHCAG